MERTKASFERLRHATLSGPTLSGILLLSACAPGGREALRGRHASPARDAGVADAHVCAVDEGVAQPAPRAPSVDPRRAREVHTFFKIHLSAEANGADIAGARLETLNHIVYTSDKNGLVAFYEPELMGEDVYFFVTAPGYELAADGFGYRGRSLSVSEGGSGEITLPSSASSSPLTDSEDDSQTRLLESPVPGAKHCFAIRVIDKASKRGVPLVSLRTAQAELVSDSQGMVAFCPPNALGGQQMFSVSSHGYAFAPSALMLEPRPGEGTTIELERDNVAERLYRSTGEGIYRDSLLLGLTTPERKSGLNGLVMAQDAVSTASYGGKLFWIWGTTDRPDYPLGNFGTAGARSPLPGSKWDPTVPPSLTYYVDEHGFSRALTAAIAPTSLPTWLEALVSVPDADGKAQLFATYAKPNSDLSVAARGLVRFDPESATFAATARTYANDAMVPHGQPLSVRHGDAAYVYYGSTLRIPATAEALLDDQRYEVWTALAQGSTSELTRSKDGTLRYAFRRGTSDTRADVVAAAGLAADQLLDGHLRDSETDTGIQSAGSAAQAFSERSQRFVRIFQQLAGISSFLGEVWYAEADTPMGPWVYAHKLLTHDHYTFYTPWLHSYLSDSSGRYLYFEGSYTRALAGEGVLATPRYDRNQIMYRLAVDDERLNMPVAVYDFAADGTGTFGTKHQVRTKNSTLRPAFFAPERASDTTLAVAWTGPACTKRRLVLSATPPTPALFYALPPDSATRPSSTVALYELTSASGAQAYALQDAAPRGYTRSERPLAYVWPSPIGVAFPLGDYLGELVANGGEDQCLHETTADDGALVTLDGSQSHSLNDEIASYVWRLVGQTCPLAHGAHAQLSLPAGLHNLELEITDKAGRTARDHLTVLIDALALPSSRPP